MELKRQLNSLCRILHKLLIVPYGIETIWEFCGGVASLDLLIVPYGIETKGG